MTKVPAGEQEPGRQADAEIEITPEMIEAGMDILSKHDARFESEESALTRAFIAMITKANIGVRVRVASSMLPRLGGVRKSA